MNNLRRLLQILLGRAAARQTRTGAQPRLTGVWDVDGVVVVRFNDLNAAVSGYDLQRIDGCARELASVAEQNPLAVVLDFENQEFPLVAAFERVLVALHQRLNGKLSLCSLPATAAAHFETNRLNRLFQIHAGLDDALYAVKIPHLALPNERRIPLVAEQLLIGRIPYDPQKHRNTLDVAKEQVRCAGRRLYLPDPHVSKRHAMLTRSGASHYAIEDVGSRGGTFVNAEPITEKTLLQVGDTIRVGQSDLRDGDAIAQGPKFAWQRFHGD